MDRLKQGSNVEMVLKRVGFFQEVRVLLGEDVSGLPSLHEAVRPTADPDEANTLNYLREGVCLAACGGVMADVLNPLSGLMTSPDYLTDGVWLWAGELAHYVAEHHVSLPQEFVAHMRGNRWVVPHLDPSKVNAFLEQLKQLWGGNAS
jgi:hypothetical protein